MVKPDRPLQDCMNAIQFAQAGALAVWSVGIDGALVCTDVTTCQTRSSTIPPTPKVAYGCTVFRGAVLDPYLFCV
jgi:hypothetical protein